MSSAGLDTLGRFKPLKRVLLIDDFDTGMHGWQGLFPDYDGWDDYPGRNPDIPTVPDIVGMSRQDPNLRIDRRILLGKRSMPMLSTLTSWDIGSQGTWSGTYALKIPTLPVADNKGLAVKRLTVPERGKVRIETYFTYKAEPSDFRTGEHDIKSFFLATDVMDPGHVRDRGEKPVRWWPGVRYLNEPGNGRWQLMQTGSGGVMDGPWTDLADGRHDLGYNRSPTKYQWHYLRITFDMTNHRYVDLHCYGKEFDVAGKTHVFDPPLTGFRASTENCHGLIAMLFGIETAVPKRAYLYLDSIVVSAEDDEAGWA